MIGCIVQARTASTRFPDKIMQIIDFDTGETVLGEVVRRLKKVDMIDKIIIATTERSQDNQIDYFGKTKGVEVFRGSEDDVLHRYYSAAKEFSLKTIVRITSDCPFIDPEVINNIIDYYKKNDFGYVSNTIQRTFPHGLDCEVFSFEALKKAKNQAKDQIYREHVTNFMYKNPEKFKIGSFVCKDKFKQKNIRITIDTKEDYYLACVLNKMISDKNDTSYQKIVALFDKYKFLPMINQNIIQKKQNYSFEEEIKESIEILEKQDLFEAAKVLKNYKG